MKLGYKFNKGEKYIVAVSYGPDSMALLNMLIEEKINVVVCHVNYHKRNEANLEKEALEKYCKKRKITFEYLDTSSLVEQGNFQEWAREVRYNFFEKNYIKYAASGLCIAHHQDDLIETYLMQKNRKNHVKWYGLNTVSKRRDMVIIRPLLNYTKEDIYEYIFENNIPFSIDMSNFETTYLRNKIRKDIINRLTTEERTNYVREIYRLNQEHQNFLSSLKEKIRIDDELEIRQIIALTKDEFEETIMQFVATSGQHFDLSKGRIEEIRKLCLSKKPNISMDLGNGISIVKEYDVLVISRHHEIAPYSYTIIEPMQFSCPEFDLDFTLGALDRNIQPSSYPLVVRSAQSEDEYLIGDNKCSILRLFIDWKMPSRLRKMWPVIEDKDGKIIYIPRYRKNFVMDHNRTSIFNIKIV